MRYTQYFIRNDYRTYGTVMHSHPVGTNPSPYMVDEDFVDLRGSLKFFTNKFRPYYAYTRIHLS